MLHTASLYTTTSIANPFLFRNTAEDNYITLELLLTEISLGDSKYSGLMSKVIDYSKMYVETQLHNS